MKIGKPNPLFAQSLKVSDGENHHLGIASGKSTSLLFTNTISTLLSLNLQLDADDTLQLFDNAGREISPAYALQKGTIWSVAPRLLANSSQIILRVSGAANVKFDALWMNGNHLSKLVDHRDHFYIPSIGTVIPNPLPVTGDWLTDTQFLAAQPYHVNVDNFPGSQLVTGDWLKVSDEPIGISAVSLPLPANAAQETGGNLARLVVVFKTQNIAGTGAASPGVNVPTGKQWRIVAGSILATTTTGHGGLIYIVAQDGSSNVVVTNTGPSFPAASTNRVAFGAGLPQSVAFVSNNATIPFPTVVLSAGEALTVIPSGTFDATDTITLTFSYEEYTT